MEIIKVLKWGKVKEVVWDEELKQTCGKIKYNYPTEEYIFISDRVGFDVEQLRRIKLLLENRNKKDTVHNNEVKNK